MNNEHKINDGGPAFPVQSSGSTYGIPAQAGMTLRDWFAGQALMGVLAYTGFAINENVTAADSYAIADAMLAERSRR